MINSLGRKMAKITACEKNNKDHQCLKQDGEDYRRLKQLFKKFCIVEVRWCLRRNSIDYWGSRTPMMKITYIGRDRTKIISV